MDYIAFFFAIKHTEIDWLEEKLKTYLQEPNNYVMSMETSTKSHQETEGQHIHILATMSPGEYKKFSTVVIRKYNLNGKAHNGLGKQYGKVNVVRDQQKMLSYTLKDKNFRTNMDEKLIHAALEKSFKKEEKIDEEQKIMDYIKNLHQIHNKKYNFNKQNDCDFFSFKNAAIGVIEYFRQKNKETNLRYNLSRNQITTLVNKYFMYEAPQDDYYSDRLYQLIFSPLNS